jgi:metallo-beta-lactamase class B
MSHRIERHRSARALAIVGIVATVAAVTALGALANVSAQSMREKWNHPTEPFHVIGNIYYVGPAGLACYLITTPAGHILLDAGLAESAPLVEHSIEALGFRLSDVKILINSHAHFDHGGGLAELKRRTGAKLVASAGDKSALEGGFYLGSESDKDMASPKVKVDRTIRDRDTVTLGDTTLTANLTPGHTRGCTSWSMTVRDGDASQRVLFFCSTSVAANRLVGKPQYPNIVRDYEATFAKLEQLEVDVFLAPHPEFFGMERKRALIGKSEHNPFIDPNEFHAFIAKSEQDFHAQLALQREKLEAVKGSNVTANPAPDHAR